jgi:hypothetical protein
VTRVAAYLKALKSYEGEQEHPRGSNRTIFAAMAGHANGYAWCASYQVGVARKLGLALPSGADTASCALNEAAYKRAGRLSTQPQVGAVGFVYFPSLQRVAHTFIVWKFDAHYVWTIEGNTNPSGGREGYIVALRKRPRARAQGAVGVRSYGMPLYGTTTPAADAHEEADMPLTDKDVERIWSAREITLTEAAAAAIGGDVKAGQKVSAQYLLQWSPLVRRTARDDEARDKALAAQIAHLTASGIDYKALAAALAPAVAAELANRLKA